MLTAAACNLSSVSEETEVMPAPQQERTSETDWHRCCVIPDKFIEALMLDKAASVYACCPSTCKHILCIIWIATVTWDYITNAGNISRGFAHVESTPCYVKRNV